MKVTRTDAARGWGICDWYIGVLGYSLLFDLWDWLPITSTHRERFFYGVALVAFSYFLTAMTHWLRYGEAS